MIKKVTATNDPAHAAKVPLKGSDETWNTHWNVRRRLLEARRKLKGTVLWAQFETTDSFEAFSIHKLARGVEEILLDSGILASFNMTRWQKNGNVTVVEGIMLFTNVDDGEQFEVPCGGEAINDSDKGMATAVSHARKNGFIQGLNLSVGIDNEGSNEKAKAPDSGSAMSGAPQQKMEAAPATNGSIKTYTLQQTGVKGRAVLGKDMVVNCWPIINNASGTASLDAWEEMNIAMLKEFTADDPVNARKLSGLVQARRAVLAEKGL